MTPTETAIAQLPPHLRRYVVTQEHDAYTPRDHAVWRHILHRLTTHLKDKAHPSYLKGLEAAGIGLERIPSLDEMNEKLARLGWRAVAVRGFVPPAVFTELQSYGVLAIAADIRSCEHLEYTPAPDIVHESAGHAPILVDPRYAEYLKRCGVVGFKAIASVEDQAVYEAIRNLSVVKEDPGATPQDELLAEARLRAAGASRRYVSESTRASRLYWWTAEYGLIGDLQHPQIYGAGLLSSIGEAVCCLTPAVRKLPLSLACTMTEYDITSMQPQLFVAKDFEHLFEVLEAFEETLSWKRGGDPGLREALRARTVNHLVLDHGLEVSAKVVHLEPKTAGLGTALVRLEGPVMVSRKGQAEERPWSGEALVVLGRGQLPARGAFSLELDSGLSLSGFLVNEREAIDLRGQVGGRPLDLPSWAWLFLCEDIPSVAGGPADPGTWDRWYGDRSAFSEGEAEHLARQRKSEALSPKMASLYLEVRRMRETGMAPAARLDAIRNELAQEWLLAEEVDELLEAAHGLDREGQHSVS